MSAVAGRATFRAKNPVTGEALEGEYLEATAGDIDAAARAAERAFELYAALPALRRAEFLRAIAQQILALGDRLLERAARVATTSPGSLTARERDVLQMLADGQDTRAIAVGLCYSERTVKNVVHDVLTKLNCRTRAQAVGLATRSGVI